MSRKRFSVEQIINHLREAEVLLAQGQTVGEICRRTGVSEFNPFEPSPFRFRWVPRHKQKSNPLAVEHDDPTPEELQNLANEIFDLASVFASLYRPRDAIRTSGP